VLFVYSQEVLTIFESGSNLEYHIDFVHPFFDLQDFVLLEILTSYEHLILEIELSLLLLSLGYHFLHQPYFLSKLLVFVKI
jgi:hypothetical protein